MKKDQNYKKLSIIVTALFLVVLVIGGLMVSLNSMAQENRVPSDAITQVGAPVKKDKFDISAVSFDNPQDIPAFAFLDPSGKEIGFEDLKGQYTLVNIWATWCTPCVVELPSLEELGEIFEGKGLKVIAVSIDFGDKDVQIAHNKVKDFLERRGFGDFAAYYDYQVVLQRGFRIRGVPTTLLMNPEGQLIHVFEGEADWSAPPAVDFFSKLLAQRS